MVKTKLKIDATIGDKQNKVKKARNNTRKKETTKKDIAKILEIPIKNIKFLSTTDIQISNFCDKHNVFIIDKNTLKNKLKNYKDKKCICPICNPIDKNSSIKENEVRHFIETELKIKSQKIKIKKTEIDIFIPEHNLGIEFNGLWWHSSKYRKSNYHLNKTEISERNNIKLLHIFEDEWVHKKDIVKSIIRSKLKIYNKKIYAKSCEIKEVDLFTAADFFDTNHLFGSSDTSINYGLYHKNELVTLICFKELTNGNFEIIRFCDKLDTYVVNGLDKLIKYFIHIFRPKSLTKNVDRRYSQGMKFKKIGFKYIKNTKPNYNYFCHKKKNVNRINVTDIKDVYMQKYAENVDKNEESIMEELGYYRIYDCGQRKFLLDVK